jgi:hypothetical protein
VTIPDRIPDTTNGLPVTTIGGYYDSYGDWFGAFQYCSGLTSVTIPNSVTSIGDYAFFYCYSLTNVIIGTNVTSIGDDAFLSCRSLTSITIPNGVTKIGDYAFFDCYSLTNVTIGNGVTSIGDYAFSYCPSLKGVFFRGNAPIPAGLAFFASSPNVTVYYLPGTTGWEDFARLAGVPIALWFLPNPLILNNGPGFGVQTNGFGFIIYWATNISVVVEACTNLANPIWSPVGTNTLTGGSSYFSDCQWTNYPVRCYRLRLP